MTLEELKAKYDLLATYVIRMRSYQMKYFKYRAIQDKNNMLRYQSKVDKLLADDTKKKDSKQLECL